MKAVGAKKTKDGKYEITYKSGTKEYVDKKGYDRQSMNVAAHRAKQPSVGGRLKPRKTARMKKPNVKIKY